MLKKLAVFVALVFSMSTMYAQTGQGTIKGKMLDRETGEPLPFANVVVMKGGQQVAGAQTDFDGKFTIPALNPGNYDLIAKYVGYQDIRINGVIVNNGQITFVPDLKAGQGVDLAEFEVIEYEVPLISKDQTSSGGTVTRENIAKMPGRSAVSVAQTVGGVFSKDDGSTDLNIRGSRSEATDTYIDGIKVRGSQNLPNSAIEQVSVITGGLPAQFGDVTGGVVNITTRGASSEWFGGIEYLTSGFKNGEDGIVGLDDHGFNLLGFSLSGPILFAKDSTGTKKDGKLGFFLSGELKYDVDPRPNAMTNFKVKDDVMEQLNAVPYSINESQNSGVINNAQFVTASDLEEIPFRLNTSRKGINLAGKVDYTISSTINLTFGGSFDYNDRNSFNRNNALFNSQNNLQDIDMSWRAYARYTQRFKNSEDRDNPSIIKDAYITLQADYSVFNRTIQDKNHQDNLSHYGYIGKFTTTRVNTFEPTISTATIVDQNGDSVNTITGYFSNPNTINYTYEAGELNPVLSNYTASYYDIYANDPSFTQDRESVQGNGGLLNGDHPFNLYNGLYNPMGRSGDTYIKQQVTQLRFSGAGSASIGNHAVQIGFEYEQRDDRTYNLAPYQLWRLGRQLVNAHIEERSFLEGSYIELPGAGGGGVSQFILSNAYNGDVHSQFDKNLRESLGMSETGLNWIDFDSYGPDVWNIEMFTPDEIYTGARGLLSTFGYDHTGKKLSGNPSLDDFFTKKDENGNFTRENPSFQPIYIAGYIQDKFAFDDLIFNVGVRIDRYDANQSVLKDKYSLFPTKTVAEIGDIPNRPSNIGDDFVVYVNDVSDPKVSQITGYRDGDIWYNADGEEISDPAVLSSSGIPSPWLVDPNKNDVFRDLDASSFKDFEPQVNVSPRISFSFPISDEALFFAHYDILTQRPSSGNRMDLLSYLNFQGGGFSYFGTNNPINNPALKAEQTIDYELGFQQKLSNYSALKLSAFYREFRNQVQMTQVIGAYPGNYFTFENMDFGTVKGMTVSFDLRRKGNITMRAAYTLQFADGTGSSATTSLGLVSSGNGNLRTLVPLSFDQRHAILLSADYRYGQGKSYNGPILFGKQILKNTGANITLRSGSGTPYTRSARIVGTQILGQPNSPQQGQLNASRLPWTNTVDLKVDRNIDIKWGKGEDEDKKEASLNVYVQVLNLFDALNIIGVYSATGNPDDDGFLDAAEWQNLISTISVNEEAFRDMYWAKLASNPNNFALPRRIRLGVQLNF
ncbi:MAG: carboxypeptidase regulatory-like domain-containing protein [Vicingaceae bacterium]|nr:carboxypeptidase regulatory-like domain-containing protein [Vicingaceae bacterium]